jgi:hypothetical protein
MQRAVWWAGSTDLSVWWAGSTDLSKEHTFTFCSLNPEDGGIIFFRNDGIKLPYCTESQVKRPQHKTLEPWKAQTYKPPGKKNLKSMENFNSSHRVNQY